MLKAPSRHCEDMYLKKSWRHVLKTSGRCLEDVLKTFWRRLEDVLPIRLEDVWKASERCLEDVFQKFWQDVLKTSSKCLEDVLKAHGQDEYIGLDQDVFWRRKRKTSSSRRMFAGYNLNKAKFYLRYVHNILTAFDNEQDSSNF